MAASVTDLTAYRREVEGLMTQLRQDAVINQLSGLGSKSWDRNEQTRPDKRGVFFDEDHLDSLYHFHRLARRIVDTPAADATRAGFSIAMKEAPDPELFQKDLQRLKVNPARKEAQRLADLTGGGAIIPILQDGLSLEDPVDFSQIRRVRALRVVDRFELQPIEYQDMDFDKPGWGKPLLYNLTGAVTTQTVHASRVLRFEGVKTRRRRGRLFYNGWGQPLLEAIWESLRDVSIILQAIGTAAHEWKYDVLKLGNLEALLTGRDGEPTLDRLQQRLDAIALTRSAIRASLLDASKDESLETKHLDFKGIVEAFAVAQQALSADTHQPLTRLWGQSPKGFTSNDDTGEKTWWSHVSDIQTDQHEPAIDMIVRWVSASKKGPTGGEIPEFSVVFNPFDLPSEKEAADTYKTIAEGDAIYFDRQALGSDDLRSRFEGTEFQTNLTLEADEDGEADDFETMDALARSLRQDAENPRAMLALIPSEAFAETAASHSPRFDPEQMHVTLAWLGRPGLEALANIQQAAKFAAQMSRPVSMTVSGPGVFFNEKTARVLLVGGVGLNELRADLIRELDFSRALIHQNHGFIPHMTIDLHDPEEPLPEGWEEAIAGEQWPQWFADKLALVIEDEVVAEWVLGQQPFSHESADPADGVAQRANQTLVGYQPAAPDPEREKCGNCGWFDGGITCGIVAGEIAEGGWCPLWGTLGFAKSAIDRQPLEATEMALGDAPPYDQGTSPDEKKEGKEDTTTEPGEGTES